MAAAVLTVAGMSSAAAQDLTLQSVVDANFDESANQSNQRSAVMLKAQVLLDRAHFSPGVIDGRFGSNMELAIAAYERFHGFEADGRLDQTVWQQLTSDEKPVLIEYAIVEDDVNGPFIEQIPDSFSEMAKLERLSYTGPQELLAEKFHMDQDLLRALNPNTDFTHTGKTIVVPSPSSDEGFAEVNRIEVSKKQKAVRALNKDGKIVAFYPATIGSKENPAPDGNYEVRAIAPTPVYYYNPDDLNFEGVDVEGQVKIPAGPNNPVGSVWIDLTKEGYGIHGTPEPAKIGKTYSHGCIRLTNWDALELSRMVAEGTPVAFLED